MKRDWILLGAALLALGLSQTAVWAERWEFLGKHPQGDMFLDRESVRQKGSLLTFWARRVYYKPQESKVSQMKFQEQWVMQELDCRKHTMNMTQMVFMTAKGKPVGAYGNLEGGPKPIEPSGFFAKEEKILCNPAVQPEVAAAKKSYTKLSKPR